MSLSSNFPDIRPSLLLDFANSGKIGLVTFTRGSTARYFDAMGILQTANTDTPRFDYDPFTSVARGLLIEEQRTNLCLHSEDFANVAWNKFNSTVTSNSSTSPSGTTTADTLSASTSDGVITQDIIVSTNTNYTFSVFLKSDTTTNLTLFLFTTSFATISSQAITVTNSWQRFTVSGNSGVNATIRVSIGGGNTFSSPEIVYAWGAQLEAGAFPTSYIATTATSATRAADVASISTISPWHNSTEGTLFVHGAGISDASARYVACFNDGTLNEFYGIRTLNNISAVGIDGGFTQWGIVGSNYTSNQAFKAALAISTNNIATSVNGAAAVTDTNATIPTVTQMQIGTAVGLPVFCGWIERIYYYPQRLSNTELQAITA